MCLTSTAIMNYSKLIENKKEINSRIIPENIYKGSCVKIKNSKKTFQVIGINIQKKICWIREWPFPSMAKKTFALEISQITLQTYCSEQFTK